MLPMKAPAIFPSIIIPSLAFVARCSARRRAWFLAPPAARPSQHEQLVSFPNCWWEFAPTPPIAGRSCGINGGKQGLARLLNSRLHEPPDLDGGSKREKDNVWFEPSAPPGCCLCGGPHEHGRSWRSHRPRNVGFDRGGHRQCISWNRSRPRCRQIGRAHV